MFLKENAAKGESTNQLGQEGVSYALPRMGLNEQSESPGDGPTFLSSSGRESAEQLQIVTKAIDG